MSNDAIVSDEEDENEERGSGDGDGAERVGDSRRGRHRAVSRSDQMKGETDRFSAVFKHCDEAQRALEETKLAVEERKLNGAEKIRAADCKERRTEREDYCKERTEKRESRERLKLEKFCMMREIMMNYKN